MTIRQQRDVERAMKVTSPKTIARLSGAFLLVTIVAGVYAQGVLSERLVASGDASATARNILANKDVVRAAFAIFMIEMACQTAATAANRELFAPVSGGLSRAAAVFGYIGCGIKILSRLFFYAPLLVLGGSPAFAAFDQKQLDSIAYLLVRVNDLGAGTACIFLGISTVMVGYLMFRSRFLPRTLGVIGVVGGLGWISYVYPPLAAKLFMPTALVSLVGCAVTIGWLLIRGVDETKWAP